MKRILLISLLASLTFTYVSAQNCSPDNSITEPGVYPEQPDTAFAGNAYSFVFQILAIKDTTTMFNGQTVSADIDSVTIDNVIGLPDGFTYNCEPNRCAFTHTAVGCLKLTGNPTASQTGVYDIKIATTAYASLGLFKLPVRDTAEGYSLIIVGEASVLDKTSDVVSIYPNPSVMGKFLVATKAPATVIQLTDIQGKVVNFSLTESNNAYNFDISSLPRGVYFVNLEIDYKTYTYKIIH